MMSGGVRCANTWRASPVGTGLIAYRARILWWLLSRITWVPARRAGWMMSRSCRLYQAARANSQ